MVLLRVVGALLLVLLGLGLTIYGFGLCSTFGSFWMLVVPGVGIANMASAARLLRWSKLPIARFVP
jgi:hypothetical protein